MSWKRKNYQRIEKRKKERKSSWASKATFFFRTIESVARFFSELGKKRFSPSFSKAFEKWILCKVLRTTISQQFVFLLISSTSGADINAEEKKVELPNSLHWMKKVSPIWNDGLSIGIGGFSGWSAAKHITRGFSYQVLNTYVRSYITVYNRRKERGKQEKEVLILWLSIRYRKFRCFLWRLLDNCFCLVL